MWRHGASGEHWEIHTVQYSSWNLKRECGRRLNLDRDCDTVITSCHCHNLRVKKYTSIPLHNASSLRSFVLISLTQKYLDSSWVVVDLLVTKFFIESPSREALVTVEPCSSLYYINNFPNPKANLPHILYWVFEIHHRLYLSSQMVDRPFPLYRTNEALHRGSRPLLIRRIVTSLSKLVGW